MISVRACEELFAYLGYFSLALAVVFETYAFRKESRRATACSLIALGFLVVFEVGQHACETRRLADEDVRAAPRRLSDKQKTDLLLALQKLGGRSLRLHFSSRAEATQYADDFTQVFLTAGWRLDRVSVGVGLPEGMVILSGPDDTNGPELVSVLRAVGLACRYEQNGAPSGDVEMAIGEKPSL